MKDDEKVLAVVGGGTALYLAYKWQKTGELPQFQLPGMGGGFSLDLSNLLGGGLGGGLGDLSGLLSGLRADDAAVRDFLGGCLTGGAAQQGGDPRDGTLPAAGGGGGGQEPTVSGGLLSDATGFVKAVGGTSPLFQAGLGILGGGLGIGAGYAIVRTAPALGRAAVYAVEGAASVGRSLGNVLSAATSRILSHGGTRVVTQSTVGGFRSTIGPLSYRGMSALGKTGVGMGIGSLLVLASTGAAMASTLVGRLLFGEQAPEKVVGWGILSALSPSEWLYGMLGGKVSAAEGEGWTPSPTGGDVTPWATVSPGGSLFFGSTARAQAARTGGATGQAVLSGGVAQGQAVLGGGAASGQAVLGARARGQASLGGAPSGGKAPSTPTGMGSSEAENSYWSYT
jgi:hypothetical protein